MNSSIKDYLKQVVSLYQAAFALSRRVEQPYYRIIKMPDKDDACIHFQVIGKNTILAMLPEEIMRDNLLLQFSRPDIVLITHLGTKNEMISQKSTFTNKFFKILKLIFKKGKTLFVIEKDNGEIKEYAAQELYSDEVIANNFSGRDGMKIGYSAAEEHYEKIAKLKQES